MSEHAARFWSRVDKTGDCWLWGGGKQSAGYGVFWIAGKGTLAHRFSWALANGPIKPKICVLHRCDVRSCVRPDHLFLGDRTANAADMDVKGRRSGFVLLRGALHKSAKLTEANVLAIRASSKSSAALAREYGVSQPTIINIKARRKWKHLKERVS